MTDHANEIRKALSDLADAATRGATKLATGPVFASEMKAINDAYSNGLEALAGHAAEVEQLRQETGELRRKAGSFKAAAIEFNMTAGRVGSLWERSTRRCWRYRRERDEARGDAEAAKAAGETLRQENERLREQVLPDDMVCACLDETGSRTVTVWERCERCHAFMRMDEFDPVAAAQEPPADGGDRDA